MTARRRIRAAALLGIGALYVASVPWYWRADKDAELRIWWGLPDWVTVALGCYAGVALLNAVAWWFTEMPAEDSPAPEGSAATPGETAP